MTVINFNKIWKTYPKRIGDQAHTALSEVSFIVNQGETLGLVGANGAGKSTAIRLLMGFMRPDKGTIRVFDEAPAKHHIRHRIDYLPETANFPSNLNIFELGSNHFASAKAARQINNRWASAAGILFVTI